MKTELMRHSRVCIKSIIDRSGQLVYALWDTLVPYLSFMFWEKVTNIFLYTHTHTHKRVWESKRTFQEKFSGYVRAEVHPLLDKPIFFKHKRILSEESVLIYRNQRSSWLGEVMSWRVDGAHYLHFSIQVFLKNHRGRRRLQLSIKHRGQERTRSEEQGKEG